ncbi:MAG: substrate-binding domain-containing protein [Tetrasphaera sp.]|nr:substrate-binding domain-containing protein [Tetrasphaera sp.]
MAAGVAASLSACNRDSSSSSSSTGSSASGSATGSAGAGKRACVILPDAASSSRWENGDRPQLDKAFKDQGVETDIQNAQNDTAKYATIAQQMTTKGCSVMLLVDLNQAGVQVAAKAKGAGIPVIAYDRPIAGADYYISFDNFHVGELEGQMIVDGLKAAGKDPATAKVVYVGGDPTDGNAKQFHDGADKVMKAGGIAKPAFETPGTWDTQKAGTYFEQAYTALQGNIDAVWVANDFNAASVIAVLDKNGKKVPVSGQDASPPGLQNILLGKQVATVYKPFQLEAKAAVDLAMQLIAGTKPDAPSKDTTGVPFFPQTPVVVTSANMKQVFDDGNAKFSEVCTGDVKALCEKAGITG